MKNLPTDVFVYRLEVNGRGAYKSPIFYKMNLTDKERRHYNNPTPRESREEGTKLYILFRTNDYYGRTLPHLFAFKSIKQYREWFKIKAFRQRMYKDKAELVVYRVRKSKVYHGNHQVVFHPDYARRITTLQPV